MQCEYIRLDSDDDTMTRTRRIISTSEYTQFVTQLEHAVRTFYTVSLRVESLVTVLLATGLRLSWPAATRSTSGVTVPVGTTTGTGNTSSDPGPQIGPGPTRQACAPLVTCDYHTAAPYSQLALTRRWKPHEFAPRDSRAAAVAWFLQVVRGPVRFSVFAGACRRSVALDDASFCGSPFPG